MVAMVASVCPLLAADRLEPAPLTAAQKNSELQQLASLVRSSYGPYGLKRDTLRVDVDEMLTRYGKKAESLSQNRDFYYLLNQFVAEFQDSHFTSRVKSRHVSYLGFVTDRIQGKALIDEVDRDVLPKENFPFTSGDEVIEMNGRPVAEVVAELGSYIGSGYKETQLRSATMFLAYRPSTTVPPQYGAVKVKIRSREAGVTLELTLPWRHKGGKVMEGPEWGGGLVKSDYLNLAVDDYFESFPRTEKGFLCSPKTRIDPPKGSTLLLASPFVAYYYPTPKGNVGYLRIPHYSWPSNQQKGVYDKYEWAVQQLEKNTVGLVIDQDHNCGGKVNFLEDMVKLFADKPFRGVEFQFLATRPELITFQGFLKEEEPNTLGAVAIGRIVDAVETAWRARKPMTQKITYHGDQLLYPNGVRYTKPIVVLADEMSGSGGDAFPAMMQGIGRAKIVGTRTMGAGGHVVEAAPLSYSGNTVRITKSLFFHPNGKPIENNGVTPDYPYTPTEYDFLNGYACYRKFYTQRVLDLVDPGAAAARAVATLGGGSVLGTAAIAAATDDANCP